MNTRALRRISATLTASLAAGTAARASIFGWLLPKHDLQVIAVTDTTSANASHRIPTQREPVYYVAVDAGHRDFGGIIAGDKVPSNAELRTTIAKTLAGEGYLPATRSHPPSLLLIWAWGTMYKEYTAPLSDLGSIQSNHRQLLRFLGGYKLGLVSKEPLADSTFDPVIYAPRPDADAIDELANDDLYVVVIGAFDFAAFGRGRKVLLWTTKISAPSQGLAMSSSLPAMLALAAPTIGRETPTPLILSAGNKLKPEVKMGEPKIIEYLGGGALPIIGGAEPEKASRKH